MLLCTIFTSCGKNADKAGIDMGVYFFSQAVTEEEAIEEADFVLDGKNHRGAYIIIDIVELY
mgnify:CR=1 FL=1